MAFRQGEQVNHYTLLEQLGEGGQGSVWKVFDPRGGGVYRALKLVSLPDAKPSAFERARREARILATASHPALIACHGLFEERDGVVGLLMDLVPGCSLAAAMREGRLDRARSSAVLGHIADALAYVHGAELVHRDLKPENILLTDAFWEDPSRPATVKLVDFGIAVSADRDTQLTRPGAVIGTIAYLAPEMLDPATWGRIEGPQRDIFAFGVLAYHLLLGRHPTGLGFDAEIIDYARAYKAAQAGIIGWPPAGIDGPWGAVVGACLALRPSERLTSGAALMEMLRTGTPSQKQLWSGISGPTAAYTETSRTAPTEVVRPPFSTTTAPAQARTIPGAPAPAALHTPPARSRSGNTATLLLVAVVAAASGAGGFAYFGRATDEAPQSTPPSQPALAPAPTPAADTHPAGPCRNPAIHFDPRDTRLACPPCPGTAPDLTPRTGLMRIYGVTMSPEPNADLPKKVCAQVKGEAPACVPYAFPNRAGRAGRLPVSSADIDGELVYFSIRYAHDNSIVAKGFGRRRFPDHFRESAFCHGFVLHLDDPTSTSTVTITVFLDET